jgi:hypothetical protein
MLPGARVTVEVRADAADVFRVTSEVRIPAEGRTTVLRSATRSFRRTTRDNRVRLEVIAENR